MDSRGLRAAGPEASGTAGLHRPRLLAATARHLPLASLAAVAAALWLAPHAYGAPAAVESGILVGFVIACWIFGLFAEPLASLLFFLLGYLP